MYDLQQYRNNIFEICTVLSEQENLRVTVKEASKGALLVAAGAGLGALLGGRMGLALGGSLSAVLAAAISEDFKSVPDILENDLSPDQKRRLVNAVGELLKNIPVREIASLLSLINANVVLKNSIIRSIGNFLSEEFDYEIVAV